MDEALIEGIIRNHDESILRFVQLYQDRVFGQAYGMLQNYQDSQEVSQDVFLKVIRAASTFEGKSKVSTWVYQITYRTCLDVLKRRKRTSDIDDIDENTSVDWQETEHALSLLEKKERSQIIDDCISRLNDIDRLLIEMFYKQELDTKEIGEIVDMSPNTVKVKIHRARHRLGNVLRSHLPEDEIKSYENGGERA